MRLRSIVAVSAAALLASGCATVRYCDEGGRHMVVVDNTGWYFLNFIPLASGDPDAPNKCSCKLIRQTTTLENNVAMLERAVAERGAEGVRNVNSSWTDEAVLFMLFKRHNCQTSAELVMPADAAKGEQCESENP